MNKEQVAFIIALALLGLMYFTGGEEDRRRRRSRSRGGTSTVEQQQALSLTGHGLGQDEFAWDGSGGGRNYFLAPRETADLPLAPLLPPPPPRLPTPGLPLVLAIGGDVRTKLRHELTPEAVDLSGGASQVFATEPENPAAEAGDGTEDPLDVLTSDPVPGGMTLADRLKQTVAERLEAEAREGAAKLAERERKKSLDQVHWPTGNVSYGVIEPLTAEDDRFRLKLAIDQTRGDTNLSEDEKRKQLDPIRLVFFEDRGRDRKRSRTVLTGANVQRLVFAETDVLNTFQLRKLQSKADDKDAWWSLATLVFARDEVTPSELAVVAAHLEEMVAADMGDAAVFGMLADCYRRLYHYDKELKILEEALAREDLAGSVPLLARFGQVCLRLRLQSKAEEAFGRALETDGGNALAHLGRGDALLQQGRVEEALVHLRQAKTGVGLDVDQKHRVWNLLGEAYLAKGSLKPARQSFDAAVALKADDARTASGLAVVTFLEAGPAAALSVVNRAREANPLDGTLAYLEAVCRARTGEYAKAMEVLSLTKDLDPLLTAFVHTGLSYLQEKAGQDEAALGEADQALVADPLNVPARLQRARCLLNVRDFEGAKTEYLTVLSSQPNSVDVLVALGDASFLSGNAQDAARYYQRAYERDPKYPDLLARRIVCDVRRRARAEAEAQVKRVDAVLMRRPYVQAAMAYYQYDRSNPQETLQILKRLGQKKLGYPELLTYAGQMTNQVSENLAKELWRDDFNRSGTKLLRGWKRDVGAGPTISLSGGSVTFVGKQRNRSGEPTVLYQERPGRSFHSFSVDLGMKATVGTHKGIGLVAFQRMSRPPEEYDGMQRRDGGYYPYYGAQVALAPEGRLRFRYLDKGRMSDWADLDASFGDVVRLEMEVLDARKNEYSITVDGAPVAKVEIPGLGRWGRTLELQVFGQAEFDPARLEFSVDNAMIITRKAR